MSTLPPREAIADALHRCVLGIDSNNHTLFSSACVQDSSMTVLAGPITITGWLAINDFFARLFDVLVTTHITSNIRVSYEEGADTATLTAHAVAYHIKPEDALKEGDTSYTAGCLYDIEVVRDEVDGLWKIRRWEIKVLWTTGDMKVLHG